MRYRLFLILLLLYGSIFSQNRMFSDSLLANPRKHAHEFEKIFALSEVGKFENDSSGTSVLLKNGYAEYKISNPGDWTAKKGSVTPIEIDLIYTKYPRNQDLWLTDYYY